MAKRLMRSVLWLAMCATPLAGALQDPTAPPLAPPAGEAAGAGIPLTAIKRVGPRRLAIIGGQEIAAGGRYEGARVVRITESEVVLRRDGETTVHKLYPQVDKRPRGK
ncbi:MAG: MSHA biogenesis protein MshK [Pseudomonadota bacterium]